MLLSIQIIIVCVLSAVLVFVYAEERRTKRQFRPVAKLKEFWNGRERRRFPRYDITLPVRYNVKTRRQNYTNSNSKDISLGGIRLQTYERIEPNTLVELEISLIGQKYYVNAEGRIVWIKETTSAKFMLRRRTFDAGIEFTKVQTADIERLKEYLNKTATKNEA